MITYFRNNYLRSVVYAPAIVSLFSALTVAADVRDGERAYRANDYAAAYQELLPAAEAGNSKAQFLLSQVLYLGAGISGASEEADRATADLWLHRAAERGYGKALESIGQEYHDKHSYERAFEYSLRAAQADGKSGTWTLGFMYCFGEGVPRDSLESDAWKSISFHPFTHNVPAWQGLQCEVGATVTQEYLMMVNRRAEEIRRQFNLPSEF